MHELSVAQCLIETACEAAAREGDVQVTRIVARVGLLSGIVPQALRFSFDLAAEGTLCAGAVLEIEETPLSVMCPHCDCRQTLNDSYYLACPACGTPTPEVLSGRELELVSVEIAPHAAAHS